jgi:hypothetical protein
MLSMICRYTLCPIVHRSHLRGLPSRIVSPFGLPINGIVLRTPDGEADMTLVKSKVLVVEDELLVARDIEQQLMDLGYQPVGLATRGEAGHRDGQTDASGPGVDGHSAGGRHGRHRRCAGDS